MNYRQTIDYLYNRMPMFERQGASGYKEGLSNTLALDAYFNHPHHSYSTIHVAGTNGKGSCSHTIAAILQSKGMRVGLYTSPHLVSFRERIRVNGEPISEQRVIDFVKEERSFFEPLHPSFFEVVTAMAFKYFEEQKVDISVIEVGLGGRLDCTNIITPLISVITNISFDHTQFLGDTLAKIAYEKAGIIKRGVPVVIGESIEETRPVFLNKARLMDAPIIFADDNPVVLSASPSPSGGINYVLRDNTSLYGELGGICQIKNTNTILTAVERLGVGDERSVREGFAHVCHLTGLRGRWERLREHPLVICDTGHNVAGWEYLSRQLNMILSCGDTTLRIVFGMVGDKDIHGVTRMLPASAHYYFTQAANSRSIPADKVKAIAYTHGLRGAAYPTVAEAYRAALSESAPEDMIFVGGSSYVVADLLSFI